MAKMKRLDAAVRILKFKLTLERLRPDDEHAKELVQALDIALDDIGEAAFVQDPVGLAIEVFDYLQKYNEGKKEVKQ